VSSDRQQARPAGLSVGTLMIASASSLIAAFVVGKLWGGGTLFGAALTPVIVAVASEGLRRPATVIGTVRDTRATRYDPVAEGRRGLAEGDLARARPARPGQAVAERRVHRAGSVPAPGGGAAPRQDTAVRGRRSRRWLLVAVATGLVAFVVAGVALTGSELLLGKSVVSSSKRTTFVPVTRSRTRDAKTTTDTTPATTTTTTRTTTTPKATTPEQPNTTPQTTPSTATPQPNSVPAAPPPAATAPAPSATPAQPAPTTSQPAPTP